MSRKNFYSNRRPTTSTSYQSANFHYTAAPNPLVVATQTLPAFPNAFLRGTEESPLDPDQTLVLPDEVPPDAVTSARTLLAGLAGVETTQIDVFAEDPSEEQVQEARQRARAAIDLVKKAKPPKHDNPPPPELQYFDQVLADVETKLLELFKLQQGTLANLVRRDMVATLKYNLCCFVSIYEIIYKVNLSRAYLDLTEQGKLMITQHSPVIRPGYKVNMLKGLRKKPQVDGAQPASVDAIMKRMIGFSGELDYIPPKLTPQQIIDLIKSKPELMPPGWKADLKKTTTVQDQLAPFLPLLTQLQQANELPRIIQVRQPSRLTQLTPNLFQAPVIPMAPAPPAQQMQRPRNTREQSLMEKDASIVIRQESNSRERSMSPGKQIYEESEDEEFLETIISGIPVPRLPLLSTDVKTARRLWMGRDTIQQETPKQSNIKCKVTQQACNRTRVHFQRLERVLAGCWVFLGTNERKLLLREGQEIIKSTWLQIETVRSVQDL
ncbi:MAG: hypothetical protein EZS28_031267 [Streblomastix strix]|uniref:Uncharacterized protein n=1 Tax=Streblomastix strix TaxID=222440 RepID=A0A5J4US22_9EUKA|nr:MAG: hypothetical protein EZS28_031267 [Streblomastix strix]